MDGQTDNWRRCVAFHGHSCPGLAIGYRAAEAAITHLGLCFSSDEELVCVTENDACGVDAIQSLTGCTIGKGNLILRPRAKMAFSFFCRKSGKSARFVFKKPMTGEKPDRAALEQYILSAPIAELFTITTPSYSVPEKARLFDGIICQECGERCAEHAARLQGGKTICQDCQNEYSRGW